MKRSELQYLSDTALIEKIAAFEFGLVKQAGLAEDLNLSSVASGIATWAKEKFNEQGKSGWGSVINILVPGILWRAHPFVAIIYEIASQYGFDAEGLINKFVDGIKPKLEVGPISEAELNNIGKSVLAQVVGSVSTAENDYFLPLRKLSNTELSKLAAEGGILQRIFGWLFKTKENAPKGKLTLGAIIIWILKTVILGIGLNTAAGWAAGMLGHKKDDIAKPSDTANETKKPISNISKSTEEEMMWVVPLVNGTIEDTLVAWTLDIYPDLEHLNNIENLIKDTLGFKKVVSLLKEDAKKIGNTSMIIPNQFQSRKQIVDLYVGEINRNIK